MAKGFLNISDLNVVFHTEEGLAKAVDGLSLSIQKSEILGIVGESGSGKSVTALSIMRLIPIPPGRIEKGKIVFEQVDLLDLSEKEMRKIRGNKISMIFQEPMSSLNPVFSVGSQISESLLLHQGLSKKEALEKSIEMLRMVDIASPEERVNNFPHQLSGGMCQRVMIAMALSCQPRLLIADEPTTALDVTIQAQILDLLKSVQREHNTAILLITHDMGVVAEMADEVVVMYLGRVVERGPAEEIFDRPQHPYTRDLFASLPRANLPRTERLYSIPGAVPDHRHIPQGCPFRGRCANEMPACVRAPRIYTFGPGHEAACWLHDQVQDDDERQHTT